MTNGEKFIQTFGNATALYDADLDVTTIHIDSDWWDAEYKGTDVLDKIRAEITEYKDDKIVHYERNDMIDTVLYIIDKYRAESEDNE